MSTIVQAGTDIFAELEHLIASSQTYQVIECDPPWNYKADRGFHGGEGNGSRLDITPKYDRMTLADLHRLAPLVQAVSDPGCCLLYLWVTNGFKADAFKLAEAWGFAYSGVEYIWVKSFNGAGTGRRARHDHEACLLFIRGKLRGHDLRALKAYGKKLHSTCFNDSKPKRVKGQTHSAKPDAIKRIAEEEHSVRYRRVGFGPLPRNPGPENWEEEPYLTDRLDMFGRGTRTGWTTIGNGR